MVQLDLILGQRLDESALSPTNGGVHAHMCAYLQGLLFDVEKLSVIPSVPRCILQQQRSRNVYHDRNVCFGFNGPFRGVSAHNASGSRRAALHTGQCTVMTVVADNVIAVA